MNQPAHLVVTHSGAFHSDELMAVALLCRFYFHRPLRAVDWPGETIRRVAQGKESMTLEPVLLPDGVEDRRQANCLVRTRDARTLAAAKANPEVFVLDVGGEFDPGLLNFDHHQASMDQGWPDGTPFSSAGLVWRWLRGSGKLDASLPGEAMDELERDLIIPLDAHDNGSKEFPAAAVCESYNRNLVEPDAGMEQFRKALGFIEQLLDNAIYRAVSRLESRRAIERAWRASPDPRYAILEKPVSHPDGTGLLSEVSGGQGLILGIPGRAGRYNLISTRGEGRFSVACPLPLDWRGRMDFEAPLDDGKVARVAFAHKTGFMCVIEGDQDLARRVAGAIVSRRHEPGKTDKSQPPAGPGPK